jgi:dedicated sortase system histidine kinase
MQQPKKPTTLTLRTKLVLVSLTLLLLPWIGYRYLHAVEQYLREGREAALLERARALAALLAQQPNVFASGAQLDEAATEHVFVRPLRTPIQLDGYGEDWQLYRERAQKFGVEHLLFAAQTYRADSLSYRLLLGSHRGYVYALFEVRDDRVVYRDAADEQSEGSDRLEIDLQDRDGKRVRYVLATSAPGWVAARRVSEEDDGVTQADPRIKGEWQETRDGYDVELRIPQNLIGPRMAFRVVDVDDAATRAVENIVGTGQARGAESLGTIGVTQPQVQNLLRGLTPPGARTWVVDANRRVLALEGGLKPRIDEAPGDDSDAPESARVATTHLFYRWVLQQPAEEFQDELSAVSQLSGPEVDTALHGADATRWRQTPDGRVSILTATVPVAVGDAVVGAVAVEETGNGILLLQNRALESLISASVMAFGVVFVVLLAFASRLSTRVRRLRDATDAAIGPDGRVRDVAIGADAGDEIGDLARSFRNMLERLAQYNRYLESMAGKLSHELRTPVSVVRSSLDNLEQARDDVERHTYVQRARAGIERLGNLLARMSEATQLEQALQTEQRVDFDLEAVVRGCVDGYRGVEPAREFELAVHKLHPDQALIVHGAPELIAQALDKLASNARDFATAGTPIIVRLDSDDRHATLSVLNAGPPLPGEMPERLFDSMVSLRKERDDQPHLGLGLYIVRLIAEFHRGGVRAANRGDVDGAVFSMTLPLRGS